MLVPKLKYEHIYLTSYSRMKVRLAAQILLMQCFILPIYIDKVGSIEEKDCTFEDHVKSVLRIHSAQAYIPMVGTRPQPLLECY